jgi:hypothetical protein
MEMLTKEGNIVAKYAQLTYPDDREVKSNTIEAALEQTKH